MVNTQHDLVLDAVEKPGVSDWGWMWGAMIWEPEFTEVLNDYCAHLPVERAREPYFTNALHGLIAAGKVRARKFEDGVYRDLGTYDEIMRWAATRASGSEVVVSASGRGHSCLHQCECRRVIE